MSESHWTIAAFGIELNARPLPSGKTIVAQKAVKIGESLYILDAKGCIRSGRVRGRYYLSDKHSQTFPFLEAAAAFGLLNKEQVSSLRAAVDELNEKRQRGWAADNILYEASHAGLTLTAAQRRYLKKIATKPSAP